MPLAPRSRLGSYSVGRAVRDALAATVVLVAAVAAVAAAAKPPITVFLVRHAEKESTGSDPSLTEAGRERAATLADVLADAGVTAIFSSEFKRTQETAAAVAARLGLTVTTVPAKDVDGLLGRVRALGPGGRALIVGHANTVPELIERMTGVKVAEMADSDYDRLFVTSVRGKGAGEVVVLRYGGATAPPKSE